MTKETLHAYGNQMVKKSKESYEQRMKKLLGANFYCDTYDNQFGDTLEVVDDFGVGAGPR